MTPKAEMGEEEPAKRSSAKQTKLKKDHREFCPLNFLKVPQNEAKFLVSPSTDFIGPTKSACREVKVN